MARDLHGISKKIWQQIKVNLSNRSLWEVDSINNDLLKEIDNEQIEVIFKAIYPLDTNIRM